MTDENFFVDLHIHTVYSDGTFTPTEVVEYAAKTGLAAVAITDHDTVDGIEEAFEAGKKYNVEIIPGIELSAECDAETKMEMHILGYYMDWKSEKFKKALDVFKQARKKRAEQIFNKLDGLGLKLKKEGLTESVNKQVIGRLHFAKALIAENYVSTVQEAFQKYLGTDKSAYVPKYAITPAQAIELLHENGGLAVLAHPYYGHYNNPLIIESLVRDGLDGIEVWHSRHPSHISKKLLTLAEKFDLAATGGSDCHGKSPDGQHNMIGKIKVPYTVVEELEKKKNYL